MTEEQSTIRDQIRKIAKFFSYITAKHGSIVQNGRKREFPTRMREGPQRGATKTREGDGRERAREVGERMRERDGRDEYGDGGRR